MTDKGISPIGLGRHPSRINSGEYEIKIKERLDDQWKLWFEGMTLHYVSNAETGQDCTTITGPVIDQPALYGLLERIRDLNLTLISVIRVYPESIHDGDLKQDLRM